MSTTNSISTDTLLMDYPLQSREVLRTDLISVCKWLKCKPKHLRLRHELLPALHFKSLVDGLMESYAKFPHDRRRMEAIVKKIQAGEPILPVFIEENDPDRFIMEGRHRIVAFLVMGITDIPVLFASNDLEKKIEISLKL